MRDYLTRLHDADNCRLCLVMSICSYALMSSLVFFLCFLKLDLIDLNTHLWVREAGIIREFITLVDLFAFRPFREDPILGAGKRLKRSFQFAFS